jgi:hypothetical protein
MERGINHLCMTVILSLVMALGAFNAHAQPTLLLPNLVTSCLPVEGKVQRNPEAACHCPPSSYCPQNGAEWKDSPRLPPNVAVLCCDPPKDCDVWELQTITSCPATESQELDIKQIKLCNQYKTKHVPVPACVETNNKICDTSTPPKCIDSIVSDCSARDAAMAENAARDAAVAGGNSCASACGIGKSNMTPVEWAALSSCYNNCKPSNPNVSCNGEGIYTYCTQTTFSNSCPSGGGADDGGNGDGGGGDCVPAATLVTLKDGSQLPITMLKSGDVVKGDNSFNTVKRLRPEKKRDLYSINGALTVTIDHPVATTEGYKIVNEAGVPNCKAHYGLDKVGILKLGDKIITDKGEIIVKTVTSVPAEDTLYNLELDGNKTFYANGILVRGI